MEKKSSGEAICLDRTGHAEVIEEMDALNKEPDGRSRDL